MATVADCIKRAGELASISDTARLDVEVLLVHVLVVERSWLYTWPEHPLSPSQQSLFDDLIHRRKQGEPIAHLTGEREFWSLPLKVNSSTLIPRPDTETLVEKALSLSLPESARVLDLGTGTGAIALALASEKPAWQITAVDAVPAAVTLAIENAHHLNFQNIIVQQSDWFSELGNQQFDLIVSNPPYIDPDDQHLQQGDVRFEPQTALVSGDHGLADLQIIITAAIPHLLDSGWLLVEHGFEQAGSVRSLLKKGGFENVDTGLDLSEKDRISFGQKGGSTFS